MNEVRKELIEILGVFTKSPSIIDRFEKYLDKLEAVDEKYMSDKEKLEEALSSLLDGARNNNWPTGEC